MKVKRIFFSLLIIFILVFVTGCGYSLKEKRHMKKIEQQGVENAINYILDKYNFSAEVLFSKLEYPESSAVPNFYPKPTGYIIATMKYGGIEFEVYITGEEKTNNGLDNYQIKKITDDTVKLINSKTYLTPYNTNVSYGEFTSSNKPNGLIKEMYTGDNLNDIIDNNKFIISFEYINTGLEVLKNRNLFSDFKKMEVVLINYYSVDSMNNVHSIKGNNWATGNYYYYLSDTVDVNPFDIESIYTFSSFNEGKEKFYKISPKEAIDGIYYYAYNYEEDDKNINDSVTISNDTISDLSNWIGRGACENVAQISKAYKVNITGGSKDKELNIYIPVKYIEGYDFKNVNLGLICDGKYSTVNLNNTRNYLVSTNTLSNCANAYDIKFTLLNSSC